MEEGELEFDGGPSRGHEAARVPDVGRASFGGQAALDGGQHLVGIGSSSQLFQYVVGLLRGDGLEVGDEVSVLVEVLFQLLDLGLEPGNGDSLVLFGVVAFHVLLDATIAGRPLAITLIESPSQYRAFA